MGPGGSGLILQPNPQFRTAPLLSNLDTVETNGEPSSPPILLFRNGQSFNRVKRLGNDSAIPPDHHISPSRSDALVLVMWRKTIDNGIPVCYNMFSFCYWMVKITQLRSCFPWIVRGPSINHSERK